MATLATSTIASKTFPVIEIFGPTIQGEGAEAGLPVTSFASAAATFAARGATRCTRSTRRRSAATPSALNAEEIVDRVDGLDGSPEWVVLSGGNPALHELGPLVARCRTVASGRGRDAGFGLAGLARRGRPADDLAEAPLLGDGQPDAHRRPARGVHGKGARWSRHRWC